MEPVTLKEVKQSIGTNVIDATDKTWGISSKLPRALTPEGLVGGVGGASSLDDHLDALVDLLALHHYQVLAGKKPPNCVRLIIGDGPSTSGALQSLAILRQAHTGWPKIEVQVLSRSGTKLKLHQVDEPAPVFGDDPAKQWATYLRKWDAAQPTGVAQQVVTHANHSKRLRLYPQLSQSANQPHWKLRLDGLEIGEVTNTGGILQVGSGKGSCHVAVQAWKEAHGDLGGFTFGADQVCKANALITLMIDKLGGTQTQPCLHGAPEHSLEAAIVRGTVDVRIGGQALSPIGDTQSPVARGSQIPTLWYTGGKPRYLDALLRDGAVPWAVEMKVKDGGGYGRYLRHAIGQAVLYRHFLRSTPAFGPWFKSHGLDQQAVRAAVVYPQPSANVDTKIARSIRNLHLTAISFDVQVATVDAPWLL